MDRSQKVGRSLLSRFLLRYRRSWRRLRRWVVNQVLHADDPPHRLALGVAIGVFVTFTPTIGFQMVLVLFFAWLLRANKAVGLPVVWLSNPATLVPIYWPCYSLGRWMLQAPAIGTSWWSSITHPPAGWAERVTFYWSRFAEVFWPLWVGGLAIGLLAGYVTYHLVYQSLCVYRIKRWGQLTPPRHLPVFSAEHPSPETLVDESSTVSGGSIRSASSVPAMSRTSGVEMTATSPCGNPNSAA
jgi:uncharacterized protein